MSTPKEIAKKGLTIVAGTGLTLGFAGAISLMILSMLKCSMGLDISETLMNTIVLPTGLATVVGSTALGLKRLLLDGPNTKMDGSPKSA